MGRTPVEGRGRRVRPRRWGGPPALAVALALTAGACSSPAPSAATATTPLPPVAAPAPLSWAACPSDPSLQCGSVTVPVDYRHPAAGSVAVAVARAPATDPSGPVGALVFNPGGPGESGIQLLPVVLGSFPPEVRRRFDIVTFDPRGTGASRPLDCGTSPSAAAAVLPVPATAGAPLPGTPLFTAMAGRCRTEQAALWAHVDTVDTARDLDRIRRALGVATVSYYGLSYGTVLGAVYADRFPTHVATMVLDGAVDVDAPLATQAREQAPAAEAALAHLLATCGSVAPCPLGADPTAAYRALAASLAAHPLPAPGGGDTVPVTEGDLEAASLFTVSVPAFIPSYLAALGSARAGDGRGLRALALELLTDLDGASLVDPMWAITCNDTTAHPGPRAAGALATGLDAANPLLGGYAVTATLGGCVAWPPGGQPADDLHPAGTPPVLVVGTTGDPQTPLVGARHLTALFPSATLLTWQGWGHTWLLNGAGDACMQQAVGRYLVGGGPPARGTVCR